MSLHEYDIPDHAVRRFINGLDDEPGLLDIDFSTYEPFSLDDIIDLDIPEAAFLAQADALVGAWRELCQSVTDMPNPEATRQTLRECLEVMSVVIDTESGREPDPAPALALEPAAVPSFKAA